MLTRAFAEALAEAEKLIVGAPFVVSEQDLAEGYDYLAGSIQASLRLAWAYQRDFPYFVQSTGPYTKMGLDNPDTLYFHAYLRDGAEYVVTGRRGRTVRRYRWSRSPRSRPGCRITRTHGCHHRSGERGSPRARPPSR
jgi:hypothetical protein